GNVNVEFPDNTSESGPGHWVTIDHDYHVLKNTALLAINRLVSMGDEGRLFGAEGKDYANTKRDKIQEWRPLPEDVDENFKEQSAVYIYGETRRVIQTFLEGDDSWAADGRSWHWQPVISDREYEKEADKK
ncbi:hypothetical protein, partial [Pseudomonas gingeri]